jgi:hypothetical protein
MSYVVVNPDEQLSFAEVPRRAGALLAAEGEELAELWEGGRRGPHRAPRVVVGPAYEYSKRFRPMTRGLRGEGILDNKFFDGEKWVPRYPRKKRRSAAKKGGTRRRRTRLARDSRGRYLKRGAKRRAAPRRAAPRKRRAPARRRTRLGRDHRGRFLKRGRSRAHVKRRRSTKRRLPALTPRYIARARRRKGVRKHMRARRTIRRGQKIAGLVRINPRTGALIMSRARVANPGKRRRKHHRKSRARRTRNPGMMGGLMSTAKAAVPPMLAGGAAGAIAGYVDTKFLANRPTVSVLAKVGLGIVGAMALRRKHAAAALGFAGGMLGATGYSYGVKFAGGHVALTGMQGLRGLADMAASDPETANLIAGLADVVPDQMGDAAQDYDAQLADGEDDQVADIVED